MRALQGWLIALAIVAGCERTPTRREERPAPVPIDARAARSPDASLRDFLDGLEPVDPPPPPIVREHRFGDCKPEYAPRPTRDPNPMCKVDGGTFSLGEPAAKAWGARRMTVQSFYIDQFEVTAAQAARFLNAVGTNECVGYGDENHRDCVIDIDNGRLDLIRRTDRFRVQPGSEERAAVFSVEGALRYCAWVGKLVPSEAQWEYAARHDPRIRKDYLYAWGNRWDPDRAYLPDDKNGPFLPGGSMPVGSFDGTGGRPDGSSPWGLHDIVGNVSEHAVRCADPDEGCGIGCICPSVSRGLTIAPELTSRSTETTPGVSPNWGGFRGLRCVRPGPEP